MTVNLFNWFKHKPQVWYSLTDRDGRRKAEFPESVAKALLENVRGVQFDLCQVTEDAVVTLRCNGARSVKLYLREGDFVVESGDPFIKA